jgi:hypothetical protein
LRSTAEDACKTGAVGARSFLLPAWRGHEKILVLQICRKNRLGLFRELELAEGAVDLGFVAAVGMILETDTDGLAVRSQCLEGITPALGFGQTLTQFDFVGNGNASFFKGIKKLYRRIRCSNCPFVSPF